MITEGQYYWYSGPLFPPQSVLCTEARPCSEVCQVLGPHGFYWDIDKGHLAHPGQKKVFNMTQFSNGTKFKAGETYLFNGETVKVKDTILGSSKIVVMNTNTGEYCLVPAEDLKPVEEKQSDMILPTDAQERKQIPIVTGVLDYFPLAIAEIAKCSKAGNDQHHPGQPLFWDKTKSTDHPDCMGRHLIDRGKFDTDGYRHSAKLAWRALANLEIELEEAKKKGNT